MMLACGSSLELLTIVLGATAAVGKARAQGRQADESEEDGSEL